MKFRFLIPSLLLAVTACGEGWKPEGRLQSKTTELIRYDSCSALEQDLKQSLIHEVWANIEQTERWRNDDSGGIGNPEAPSAGDGGGGGGRQEGIDYSGTNNQEDGVDEADNVKTDGYHLYAINGNRLHIYAVPQFGDLDPVSSTLIEGYPTEMLLHKDANRAVVFSQINSNKLPAGHPLRTRVGKSEASDAYWYWRVPQVSKVTVLDISNRAAPRTDREFYFEGSYQTARRIDTSVRIASYASIDRQELWDWYDIYENHGVNRTKEIVASRIRALSLSDLLPQIYARTAGDDLVTHSFTNESCSSFMRPTDSHARGVSSILSFDLLNQDLVWDADHVISNYATFYASKDALVLAESAHNWWWFWWWDEDPDQLNVHTFDISQPGVTSYLGSGRVEGTILNQFAIDEEQGSIRVATTTNPWRGGRGGDGGVIAASEPPQPSSNVWVLKREGLGNTYATIGHLGGIAPGERITAARFLGDKGYLVTFRQVDPLFTVDLSDPRNPRLAGELKIPGFSTYLHPLADGKLLSIGVGGDDRGANWQTTISLFDVSNFDAPRVTEQLPIAAEGGWGWSAALWEHKAFTYFAPKKLLAVPQSNYDYKFINGRQEYRYLSKLELIEVDPVAGLTRKGGIDHSAYYQADPFKYWGNVDIRRSVFMGDFVYAISDKAITVHRLSDLGLVNDAALPGFQPDQLWWGPWGF
jgi:Beta propeller domain